MSLRRDIVEAWHGFRFWLLRLIAGSDAVGLNLRLRGGLSFGPEGRGFFHGVEVNNAETVEEALGLERGPWGLRYMPVDTEARGDER